LLFCYFVRFFQESWQMEFEEEAESSPLYKLIALLVVAVTVYLLRKLVTGGRTVTPTSGDRGGKTTTRPAAKKKQVPSQTFYTAEEVAKHCTREDLWLIIDGKVYDVTQYVEEHHGGDAILNRPGLDNTEGFRGTQHPEHVKDTVEDYWIGMLRQ
jgi:predicted heme/steroid binding protein